MVLSRLKIEELCEEGCYLLLIYNSEYLNSKGFIAKIIVIEFTLLSIISEEEDRTQMVDIFLNEYIFGIFEYPSINILKQIQKEEKNNLRKKQKNHLKKEKYFEIISDKILDNITNTKSNRLCCREVVR